MKKTDFIVIGSIVLIGAVLAAALFLLKKPGDRIIVSVDGKETASYPLSENLDQVITGIGGTNRLIIRDGEAWIEEADCPDKLCVKQGHISHSGESIICLPHRVSIRVEGSSSAPDAVVGSAGCPTCQEGRM